MDIQLEDSQMGVSVNRKQRNNDITMRDTKEWSN